MKRVDIIGVPMDLGASRRGVDMGPSAVRYARLHERLQALGIQEVVDHGNLYVPIREAAESADQQVRYYDVIEEVCGRLSGVVERVAQLTDHEVGEGERGVVHAAGLDDDERLAAAAINTAGVAEGVRGQAAAGDLAVGVEDLFAE